jgi:glutamine synthetase
MTAREFASLDEYTQFGLAHPEVEFLDAFIIDVNGNAIGKRIPWQEGRKVFEGGLAFSACAPLLDCRGRGHDAGGKGASDGDPDGIALPLSGTLVPVPWASAPTAQIMCSMRAYVDQSPLWFDQRVVLQGLVDQCRAQGLHPVMACELEFYLYDLERGDTGALHLARNPRTGLPPGKPTNLSLDSVEELSALFGQVEESARAQHIPLSNALAEYGIGQFELNLHHVDDPLLAADHAALLRRLIRGVARAHDMGATFIAKPFKDQPGNGMHVHISLVDDAGRNRFAGAEGKQLLRQAIAGMQALMFDSVPLYAPNFNSFRRYLGPYVPNTTAWGHNNRSVAFRVPAAEESAMRIEHRVAGADASPHLVVAGVLAGVLHGISNKLTPTEPIDGRPVATKDPEFPQGIWAALERLSKSELLARYIPKRYLDAYVQLKRGELNTLFEDISVRELDFYL